MKGNRVYITIYAISDRQNFGFHCRIVHVEFLVLKVEVGFGFLQKLCFFPRLSAPDNH